MVAPIVRLSAAASPNVKVPPVADNVPVTLAVPLKVWVFKKVWLLSSSATVPPAFGKVIVLLAVGSVILKVVAKPLSVAPWKTSGEPPRI